MQVVSSALKRVWWWLYFPLTMVAEKEVELLSLRQFDAMAEEQSNCEYVPLCVQEPILLL
jgi:hypothetical protein